MKASLFALLLLWTIAGTVSFAGNPVRAMHCNSGDDSTCTAANGRVDAMTLVGQGKLGLMVWGGPAAPQLPLKIILQEYKRAGILVWLTGDTIPLGGEHEYQEAFNQAMERAIGERKGPDYVHDVVARVTKRINAAEARASQKQ
jgi:hypothetical protein